MMDIVQAVSRHIEDFGWPEQEVRLGPYRCNKRCRTAHAWAWIEVRTAPRRIPITVFRYFRPHDRNDLFYQGSRKFPLPEWLKEKLNGPPQAPR